ncbi:MAG: TIGR01777 family oxidoreductase [Bacteroidales bacterium]|nr:TIGR01777 family oxidoreductase [Bacteroidales bacterium]MCF8391237.1 TIGR01777 family oxidoreductase [Bacteroidales bacterium]
MPKVLMTGGTGLIGSALSKKLVEKGYEVAILSRGKKNNIPYPIYTWDYKQNKIDPEAMNNTDFIIHLSGANIGEKRWSPKRKNEILESRVISTECIQKYITEHKLKIKAFISASAVGYYGSITSDKIFSEEDGPHDDFLGNTCRLWEEAVDKIQIPGVRTLKIRTGIVFTKARGALAKMIDPLKFGIGPILGNGEQYLPWIHIDDLCNIYIRAMEDSEMKGSFNAVAPEHISYKEFIEKLKVVYSKPFLKLYIPSFLIKIMFGKMSDIILNGSRVSSEKLQNSGYKFSHPTLDSALIDLL